MCIQEDFLNMYLSISNWIQIICIFIKKYPKTVPKKIYHKIARKDQNKFH